MNVSCPYSRAHGFTLVELMISLVLSLFLIGGAVILYTAGFSASRDTGDMARAQESLRFISNFLVQDLRMAGRGRPEEGDFSLSGNELTVRFRSARDCTGRSTFFLAAVDGDPDDPNIDNPGFAVNTYRLDASTLVCDGKRPWLGEENTVALIDGVRLLDFVLLGSPDPYGVVIEFGLIEDPFPDSTYRFHVAFRNRVLLETYR